MAYCHGIDELKLIDRWTHLEEKPFHRI